MADGHAPPGDNSARSGEFEGLLDRLACVGGRPRMTTQLAGGLTNTNLRVTTSDRDVVVRISSKDSDLLAVDREAEHANSQAAAAAGVAPAVVEYVPDAHLLVVEYVDGHTLTDADLDDEVMLGRVAQACRTLHAGPRFVNDFDMFEIQRSYLQTVLHHGYRLPPRYLEFMPAVDRLKAALSSYPQEALPCNNDLLAANIIDDGNRIWIIDYEYAGNNDPFFEIGNVWSEASLPTSRLDVLVAAYVGHESPGLTARARLQGLMSKYGWMLWASIQDATSRLDFDFWEWGMEKYDRAVAEFDGPDLEQLLESAAQHTGGNTCPTPPT